MWCLMPAPLFDRLLQEKVTVMTTISPSKDLLCVCVRVCACVCVCVCVRDVIWLMCFRRR